MRALARVGHAARLHEGLEALAAHRGVDLEIGRAHDARELLQHEEVRAVAHQADPVARAYQLLLLLAQARFRHRGLGVGEEALARLRPDHVPEEAVELQRAMARAQVEGIGAGEIAETGQLRVHRALTPRRTRPAHPARRAPRSSRSWSRDSSCDAAR